MMKLTDRPSARPVTRKARKASPRVRQAVVQALEGRTLMSTYTVNTLADTVDSNSAVTSLREAVNQANSTTGVADSINFDPAVFATPQTITLTTGQLKLTFGSATTINGPGADRLSVSGNNASRVFEIGEGAVATLSGLTITGGAHSGALLDDGGGGVYNRGTATLANCTVSGNRADSGGGVSAFGGLGYRDQYGSRVGIPAATMTTLIDCTISGNTALYFGGGVNNGTAVVRGGQGTEYSYSPGGPMTLTNCTVSGNTVISPKVNYFGESGEGGGVSNVNGAMALVNTTVSGNNTTGTGISTGVFNFSRNPRQQGPRATVTVRNTIIAGNYNAYEFGGTSEVGGEFTSGGNNLIGIETGYSSGWVASDMIGVDAKLTPLGDYGGATPTMALLPGSPAIDAGASGTGIPATDQRGLGRVGATDIGAVESQGYALTAAGGTPQSTYVGTTFATPLAAKLTENVTNASLPGGTVAFTGPASGAGIATTPLTATTDSTGVASVLVRANGDLGAYAVTATAPAAPATPAASFSLSNVLPGHTLTPTTFADGTLPTTLRGAVIAFNNDPRAETNTILLNAGRYSLTARGTGEEFASTGDLDITNAAHKLIIRGNGATGGSATTIDAAGLDRVFQVVNPGTSVEFQSLIITRGVIEALAGDLLGTEVAGGGVHNNGGNLTFTGVTFADNRAAGGAFRTASGGAVFSAGGAVRFDGCTFSGNVAEGGDGTQSPNGAGQGGALAVQGGGAVTVTNSTFSSNRALGGFGIAGRASSDAFGAGPGAPGGPGRGGAVWSASSGPVTITNSTFSSNQATGGQGGTGGANTRASGRGASGHLGGNGEGGGVWWGGAGSLAVTHSTFDANQATGGAGGTGGANTAASGQPGPGGPGGNGLGGGLAVFGGGPATVLNTTFSGSMAQGGAGGTGGESPGSDGRGGYAGGGQGGGALGGSGSGTSSFTNSTFAGNGAVAGLAGVGGPAGNAPVVSPTAVGTSGGGLAVAGGAVTVNNTLLASSTGGDLVKTGGTLTGGYNLIRDGSGGAGMTATVTGDPLLDPLADNGGPTRTMALRSGSPATDAGSNALVPADVTTDQRGLPRRHNGLVDIGAFEDQTAIPAVSTSTAVTSSAGPSTYGDAVTFTATVASTAEPTGGVTFVIDGTPVAGVEASRTATAVTWTYTTSALTAGTHTIRADYDGTGGFSDSSATLAGGHLVNKAASAVAVTVIGGPFTYTGLAQTPATVAVTGAGGLSLAPAAVYADNVAAGSATASYTYSGDANYEGSTGSTTFAIGKATATVVVAPYAVTYDGSPHAATYTTAGVNGETGAAVGTGTLSAPHTDAGTYGDTWSFAGGANYNDIASTAITNVIRKASSAVTVTVNGGPFTYTGLAQAPATVTVTGAGGLNISGVASYANNVHAGTATASYSYAGDANHEPGSGSATFTIGKADAAVVVGGYSGGTYDGAAHTRTVTVTGVPSDGELYATSLAGTNAGEYSQPWSSSNANYNDVGGTLAFTIAKADATFTVTAYAVTYDGQAHAATVSTVTGVNGESGATVGGVTLNTTHTSAGTYTDFWSFAGGANYNDVAATTITNTINKAALTITADSDSKVYGTLKTFSGAAFTQAGLVTGDAITGVTTTSPGAAVSAPVGTYAIVPAAATGSGLANYHIAYVNGTLTVFPPLTVPTGVQTAYEDVDAAIGGVSIGAGLTGDLTLTLAAGHGTLTLGTTAGLTVTGNGTGAVSLTGSTAALNAALPGLVYRGGLNYGGPDTLSLTLGNAAFSWNASAAITVVSAAQQATDLTVRINTFVAAGVLTSGQGESLNLNLRDNNGDAGKVQAYLNQVSAFLGSGILTQAQAAALQRPGNVLLLGVSRR